MSKESACHSNGISGNCGDECEARRKDCSFSIEHRENESAGGMIQTLLNCDGWEYLRSQPAGALDHAFIDPPYGIELPWREIFRVVTGNVIVFERPNVYFPYFATGNGALLDNRPTHQYFWIKPSLPKNTVNQLANPVEVMYVWQRGVYNGPKVTGMSNGNYSAVRYDQIEGAQLSPFQKPESLIEWLYRLHTKPGDKVFDPTCGTGTSLAVGERLGRNVTGCEIDAVTYGIARQRLDSGHER